MSNLVEPVGLQEPPCGSQQTSAKPLDESVWQAWAARGRAQDGRSSAARVTALKWASILGLLVAVGMWSHVTPYDVVVRFIVASSAIFVMFQTLRARQYAFAAVFGALALLYNPVAPVFSFTGDWQRAVVLSSAVPFIASLAGRKVRQAHNG